ncbi:hypothetical protein [Myroides phaeus]|uniref:hypothetical protein n=1 Tax=Myroides TaxID=76831 RepID=UPI00397775B1
MTYFFNSAKNASTSLSKVVSCINSNANLVIFLKCTFEKLLPPKLALQKSPIIPNTPFTSS